MSVIVGRLAVSLVISIMSSGRAPNELDSYARNVLDDEAQQGLREKCSRGGEARLSWRLALTAG